MITWRWRWNPHNLVEIHRVGLVLQMGHLRGQLVSQLDYPVSFILGLLHWSSIFPTSSICKIVSLLISSGLSKQCCLILVTMTYNILLISFSENLSVQFVRHFSRFGPKQILLSLTKATQLSLWKRSTLGSAVPLTITSLLWISTAHLTVEKIVRVQKVLQVLHRELSHSKMSWAKFHEVNNLDISHFMEFVIILLWSRWANGGGGEWSLSLHGGHTEQKA